MSTLVAVGAQWGDEGKGKIVDWLARGADLVVRFQGGNNAGHTLVVDGRKIVLHVVPAGVLQPNTINLIGPGVVVDPRVLLKEIEDIRDRGALKDPSRVRVSGRAHVILDWHTALDKARDEALRERAIGTTGRGIGPSYEDKIARRGIRVAELLDPASLRITIDRLAELKNFELTEFYKWTRCTGAPSSGGVASSPTSTTRRASSRTRSTRASACSSRARRGRSSTSITAPIRT